ncbi:MAG: hypothetical protein AB7T14_02845 [Candidatus Methylacidiphilaceae bacterium]
MRRQIFLVLLFLAATLSRAFPQQYPFEAGVGIVYAPEHAFILKAPDGWILDRESRSNSRPEPIFYPIGFTAKDTPVIIWAGSKRAESGGRSRIEKFLEERERALSSPRGDGVKAVPLEQWRVGKGLLAATYDFVSEPGEHLLLQRVSCILTGTSVDYVAVQAKDESFYARSLAAFASIVKSYIPFWGGTVFIPR